MLQTLNTYPNLYLNPIEIPDYTIVEIYKDSIALVNNLGYCIVPLGDKDNTEIKQEISNRVKSSQPTGYTNFVILAGRESESFNHRVTYVVWYTGETVPTYPELPTIETPADPAAAFNRFNEVTVVNQGVAATDLILTLTVVKAGLVEVYINDNYYSIIIDKLPAATNLITISKTGVSYNDKNYDKFTFSAVPTLTKGSNTIKVTKENVSNLKVDYVPMY